MTATTMRPRLVSRSGLAARDGDNSGRAGMAAGETMAGVAAAGKAEGAGTECGATEDAGTEGAGTEGAATGAGATGLSARYTTRRSGRNRAGLSARYLGFSVRYRGNAAVRVAFMTTSMVKSSFEVHCVRSYTHSIV